MKKSRKIVSLLVLLVLMMSLLTGCNSAEFNYWEKSYKQYENAMNSNVYGTAEMTMNTPSMDLIVDSLSIEEKTAAMPILSYLKDGKFKMEVVQNVKNDEQMVKIYGKASTDLEFKLIYEMVRIDHKNYIKIEPVRAFITTILPNEDLSNDDVLKIIGNTKYLVISDEELNTSFNGAKSTANPLGLNFTGANMTRSSKEQLKTAEVVMKILNDVIRKSYDGYSMGLIKQSGDRFTSTLELKNMGKVASGFLSYSIDNSDKIQEVAFSSAKAIPASAYATIAGIAILTEIEKNDKIDAMQKEVKEALKEAPANKELILSQLESIEEDLAEMVGDSKIISTTNFIDDNHVEQEFAMNLEFKMPGEEQGFAFNMNGKSSTEYNSPFVIPVPTGTTISLTEVATALPKVYKVEPHLGVVRYADGLTSKEVDLDVIQSKGYNYIAVNSTTLFTNHVAKVDLKKKTAVISRDNKTVTVPIEIFNKKPYMKIAELKKIGFSVTWDDIYEVIIIKVEH